MNSHIPLTGLWNAQPAKPEAGARVAFFSLLLIIVTSCVTNPDSSRHDTSLVYPVTAKTNQVDDYHGTLVSDPYPLMSLTTSYSWTQRKSSGYFRSTFRRTAS
jgi:hypothetical protein